MKNICPICYKLYPPHMNGNTVYCKDCNVEVIEYEDENTRSDD